MDFELPEEARMLQELVQKFVANELLPLEPVVLEREARGEQVRLTPEELAPLHDKCREIGLWGLDVPPELGGEDIGTVAKICVSGELAKTIVPFVFPPDSPNLHMLIATVNEDQRERYLLPYARGETVSAIAISEPGAGSDPSGMTTRAERDGDGWRIDGRKIWISRAPEADFTIAMARTDPGVEGRDGITAFLIDRGTPGFEVGTAHPMLGGYRTYEVVFDNCRVSDAQVLGRVGGGFAPMQLRLTIRRLEMGAWSVAMAQRALDMMVQHAKSRRTFGTLLADRQAIQWWIADAATQIHAAQLMVREAAWKVERGDDVRTEASMIKVFSTEMATEVIDHAIQTFGAMGIAKETPLHLMYQQLRAYRIFEGPTEVHRWVIARRIIRDAPA